MKNPILFLLAASTLGFSQVSLVCNMSNLTLEQTERFVSFPGNCGILVGPLTESVKGEKLDDWNDKAFYYILYPKTDTIADTIRNHGKVLLIYKDIVILKRLAPIDSSALLKWYEPFRLTEPRKTPAGTTEGK